MKKKTLSRAMLALLPAAALMGCSPESTPEAAAPEAAPPEAAAVAPAAPAAAVNAPLNISGVWQWGRCVGPDGNVAAGGGFGGGFNCMLLEEDDARLTARAKAYRDAIDEAAQPKYDCAPMSIPHMWTDPYSHRIEQFDDHIVFTYGKDDVVRTAWLPNANKPKPLPNEYTYFGYSFARYEGDKLIVETTHFSFDPQGLNADFRLASSTQKKVVETYSKVGDELELEVVTTDPFFLKEPWIYKIRSQPDPEELALPWACDQEASRSILKLTPPMYPTDPEVVRLPE